MGESGSGKTTLMEQLISYFSQKKTSIAYHNQSYSLISKRTVIENINLIFQLQKKKIPINKVDDILSDIGLSKHKYKKASELSEGMKQRLNLAKTLIQDVKTYFLDEPFSAQDPAMRRHLCNVIKKWTNNKTCLIISHNTDESLLLGDEFYLLENNTLKKQKQILKASPERFLKIKSTKLEFSHSEKRPTNTTSKNNKKALCLITINIFLFWQFFVEYFQIPIYLLPDPYSVFGALIKEWKVISYHFMQSFEVLIIGIFFSLVFSFSVAILLYKKKRITEILDPIFVVVQSVPVFLILPIILYLTGNGRIPKIIVITLSFFFPIVTASIKGLQSLPKKWQMQYEALNPSRLMFFLHIRTFFAKNIFWQGFRISLVHAPINVLSCDWIGSSSGLGYLIMLSHSQIDLPLMFSGLMCVVGLSVLLNSVAKKIDDYVLR